MSIALKQAPQFLQLTLASAGTAQQLSVTTLIVKSFTVQAANSNTGLVFVANSNANAKVDKGIELDPGSDAVWSGDEYAQGNLYLDLSEFYFDGATTGNKVIVTYLL